MKRIWKGRSDLEGYAFHVKQEAREVVMFHVKQGDRIDRMFHVKQIGCETYELGDILGFYIDRDEWEVCGVSRETSSALQASPFTPSSNST